MNLVKKQEIILLALVLTISFTVWRFIIGTQFQGEGFYYFTKDVTGFANTLAPDFFARAVFHILPRLFGGHVFLYMWFQLIWILFTEIVFYLTVRVVTKNKYIAILATLFFSLSFVSKYDMFATGGYQYFVQRGVILLPQLLSFLFFSLYLSRGTYFLSHYYLSLLLYIFSIIMGFFGTWFLPVFLGFPLFYLIFNWQTLKKHARRIIWTPIPFLLSNLLIIKQSSFVPGESIQSFVYNNIQHVITGILQQLAVVTPGLVDALKYFNKNTFEWILILTAVLYCLAFTTVYILNRNLRALIVTTILSLAAMLVFNMYLNEANVLHTFGSSRYFYYPFTMVAVFWSIFFYSVASKGRLFYRIMLILCPVWVLYNIYQISQARQYDEPIQTANRETIDYVTRMEFGEGSFVQLPASIGGWGHEFVSRFYSKQKTKFYMEISDPIDLNKLVEQNVDANKVYVLHYAAISQSVVDQTESVRKQILELKMKE